LAFNGTSISSVDLSNISSIGTKAFAYTQVTSISLSISSEGTFGIEIFGNSELKDLVITNATEIGYRMFANSLKLSSLTLPSNIKKIKNEAFDSTGIVTLNLSSNAEILEIENWAFKDCVYLQNIFIAKNTTIEQNTFYGCTGLKTVICKNPDILENSDNFFNSSVSIMESEPTPTPEPTSSSTMATSANLNNPDNDNIGLYVGIGVAAFVILLIPIIIICIFRSRRRKYERDDVAMV